MHPENIHPRQRQPHPSNVGLNRAVQPYKPKTLRGRPKLLGRVYWEPDVVRFKGHTTDWAVQHVDAWRIHLVRVDSRGKQVTKMIRRSEQHRLEIVYQPPRNADVPIHELFRTIPDPDTNTTSGGTTAA